MHSHRRTMTAGRWVPAVMIGALFLLVLAVLLAVFVHVGVPPAHGDPGGNDAREVQAAPNAPAGAGDHGDAVGEGAAQAEHGAPGGQNGQDGQAGQGEPAEHAEQAGPGGHAEHAEQAGPGGHAEHAEQAGPGGHTEHGEHDEHPPELPDLLHLIYKALGGPEHAPAWMQTIHRFREIIYALLVATIIIVVVRLGTRRMTLIPGGAQNLVEMFVDGFHNFIVGILGREEARRYVPFLGSLFLYIWWMNLFGLFPLMRSPTAALSTTAALGGSVFLYVQWVAVRRLGPLKYLHHLAGEPQDPVGWALVPLMFPLHVIGELAKPVSLSLRLFGNIFGEDILIGVFAGLGIALLAFIKSPVGVPLHFPFILLALLMSTIQALVFTLLSTIYIMQVLPHHEHHEHHGQPGQGEAGGKH